jgi:transglutaminase-like putative cysteine protease
MRRVRNTVCLMLVGHALALAGDAAATPPPVLHEYVPPPEQSDAYRWTSRAQIPDHIALPDRVLPRPDLSDTSSSPSRVLDAGSGQRSTSIRADRNTELDELLDYTAEFNPTVMPFKRMSAVDQVEDDLSLGVRDESLKPMRLARRPTPPDRDAFWGAATLRLSAGVPVPIPSVAPDAAIVDYRTEPARKLVFFRDSADNHWVRSDTSGTVRFVWLSDAPKRYFAPQIPPLVTLRDLAPRRRPRLPAPVKRQARIVLERIGVRPNPLRRQLERLVSYFRNFEAGTLQSHDKSPFLDLALNQRGVCRHRSYAFVVTVQALGLPARYVQNEAHAFAEVFVPRSGWIRIDLGGAAPGVRVQDGLDKTLHQPAGPDPFPQPSRFATNYTQRRSLVQGIGQLQAASSGRAASSGGRIAGTPASAARNSGGSTTRATRSPMARPSEQGAASSGHAPPGTASATAYDTDELAADQPSTPTPELSVYAERISAHRGEALQVWGSAQIAKRGIGGLRVEVHLSDPEARRWILVGATATDSHGSFRATITVPRHLPVGDYLIRVAAAQAFSHVSLPSQ